MPARIERLEGPIVDQIAAGEVVERPASVAKELLENSLDAGAMSITLDLEEGGRARIRIADDGMGMVREDARLAIERHATSKLRTAEDLAAIHTFGFRGEALPSIASVSTMTLVTRPRDEEVGTEVLVRGGDLVHVRDAGTAPGTIVDVRELFFNVPARLKFLKSKTTEAGAVYDVALRVALANPELRLTVTHDGRRVHSYLPVRDRAERARATFEDEDLQRIDASHGSLRVLALLGAPERARSGTRFLHFFVNGRPVQDVKLARAVTFAYGSVVPPGRFPSGVVYLEMPHDEVDVNAHPQKREVRFAKGAGLYESLTRALSRELGTKAWGRGDAPRSGPAGREPSYWDSRLGGRIDPNAAPVAAPSFEAALGGAPRAYDLGGSSSMARDSAASRVEVVSTPPTAAELPIESRGTFGSLRFLAQVRRMFLVCEGATGLTVLDQHAVDERILYHRMRSSLAARRVEVQRLLFPERLEVSSVDAERAEAHARELADAGLECARIGPTTLAIHTVPSLLARARPQRLAQDLLAELAHEGDRSFGDALDTAVATMACHAAIRAGDELSPTECQALLRALDEVDAFAGHCPHGRPVVTTLPWADLEKKLGR